MKVLMATDGSVHASGAMLTASRFLRLDNTVDVVCVAPQPAPRPSHAHTRAYDAHRKRLTASTQGILNDAQCILTHAHLKTHGILEFGSPADRLLALSSNYDLVIAGAYGGHDRKQPGLGPVSSRLLQGSSGNVMIGRELVNEDYFRVLAALDSSEASFNALQALFSLSDPGQLDVTLMHVIELPWANPSVGQTTSQAQDDDVGAQELEKYRHELDMELRRAANEAVSKAQRQLERLNVPATPLIKEGDPALELCSEAEAGGYDLVLVGATGVSDVKHALLGSVSLKLAWDAPCSVAVIRQPIG